MGQARMRELKRAARQLGVTGAILRQQGWETASPVRVRAAREDPPDWLAAARERRPGEHRRRDRVSTAARLGIQPRAVRERGIEPGEVGGLLAARPGWLIAERRQAQIKREADDKLRRELADALVTSVHEVWFQELKTAVTGADADAITVSRKGTRLVAAFRVIVQRPIQPGPALPASRVGVDVGVRVLATVASPDGEILQRCRTPARWRPR